MNLDHPPPCHLFRVYLCFTLFIGLFPSRLLLLFGLPGHDHRPGAIAAERQMGAAGQTIAVVGDGAEDAQTDAADEADADDVAVTEASGAEVDVDAGRQDQMGGAGGGGREEGCEQIGQEGLGRLCCCR